MPTGRDETADDQRPYTLDYVRRVAHLLFRSAPPADIEEIAVSAYSDYMAASSKARFSRRAGAAVIRRRIITAHGRLYQPRVIPISSVEEREIRSTEFETFELVELARAIGRTPVEQFVVAAKFFGCTTAEMAQELDLPICLIRHTYRSLQERGRAIADLFGLDEPPSTSPRKESP